MSAARIRVMVPLDHGVSIDDAAAPLRWALAAQAAHSGHMLTGPMLYSEDIPTPTGDRYRILRMARTIWAVHDSTKQYGSRATFFDSEAEAKAFVEKGSRR